MVRDAPEDDGRLPVALLRLVGRPKAESTLVEEDVAEVSTAGKGAKSWMSEQVGAAGMLESAHTAHVSESLEEEGECRRGLAVT